MAKEYVPIFFDWLETTQDLSPEEKGNLIDAVVAYASGQEYEHLLQGGARIAFRFLKGQVDRNSAISDARSKAGSNKPEQTEANGNKPEQTETNGNKPEQTGTKSPKEKEKEKEKENKKENDLRAREEAERFDRFWMAYPRKENKQKALAAFVKLHPDEATLAAMLAAIERQKASDQWQEDGGRFIPHPTTWLNGKRWEDETPKATGKAGKIVIAQQYQQRDYSGQQDSLADALEVLRGSMM